MSSQRQVRSFSAHSTEQNRLAGRGRARSVKQEGYIIRFAASSGLWGVAPRAGPRKMPPVAQTGHVRWRLEKLGKHAKELLLAERLAQYGGFLEAGRQTFAS